MSDRTTIAISKRALELAEKRAAQEGVSPEKYVDELIADDSLDHALEDAWFRQKIEEGLKSGDAGLLTRERLRQLVNEGMSLADRDKG